MSDINERIKKKRLENGLTLEQVAEALNVHKSTILRYESKEIEKMPIDIIPPLAKILRCTPEYLMGWEEEEHVHVSLPSPEAVRSIPIYNNICCGDGLFVDDEIVDIVTIPVSMLPNKNKEYFAQYAKGDSMINAGISDGDLVIFEKTSVIEPGDIGCFCVDDGMATCKKFSVSESSMIYLLPANDKYAPIPIDVSNECFKVVGKKVLQIKKG